MFGRKFDEIILLELKHSFWGKILRMTLPGKRISFLPEATNAYACIPALFRSEQKNESCFVPSPQLQNAVSMKVRTITTAPYMLIGLGSETWTYRSPDAATWSACVRYCMKRFPEQNILLLGRGKNDQDLSSGILKILGDEQHRVLSLV